MKQPSENDEVKPPVCDSHIFEIGSPIALLSAKPKAAEAWVRAVAEKSNTRLDWHYDNDSGGAALVLHTGDADSRKRAERAVVEMKPVLKGNLLKIYTLGQPRVAQKV
jgi:hypothetical protein